VLIMFKFIINREVLCNKLEDKLNIENTENYKEKTENNYTKDNHENKETIKDINKDNISLGTLCTKIEEMILINIKDNTNKN